MAGGNPDWHADAEQRLRLSMLVSAIAILSAISLVRLPPPAEITPLLELVVELTRPAPLVEPEPEPEIIPPPVPRETPLEPSAVPDAPGEIRSYALRIINIRTNRLAAAAVTV